MKTTLTQKLKKQVKQAYGNYEKMQEELLEQIASSRSNKSLSRFTNSFEDAKKMQTVC